MIFPIAVEADAIISFVSHFDAHTIVVLAAGDAVHESDSHTESMSPIKHE